MLLGLRRVLLPGLVFGIRGGQCNAGRVRRRDAVDARFVQAHVVLTYLAWAVMGIPGDQSRAHVGDVLRPAPDEHDARSRERHENDRSNETTGAMRGSNARRHSLHVDVAGRVRRRRP